jgi:hypothetical protein
VTAEQEPREHIRVRPSWDCNICGHSWPCATAKENLVREFDRFPSVLTIFMATQMYDAFDDLAGLGKLPPAHLYERFLGWIHIQPPAPADDPTTPADGGDDDRGTSTG